jgi:hypothetical protein
LIAAACAAGLAVAIGFGSRFAQVHIAPGTEVLSVDEGQVRKLTYKTDRMTLTASRMREPGPFAVQVAYNDGRAPQQCEAAPNLAGLLPAVAKITAQRHLTQQQAEAEFPVQLGTLVLEDQLSTEPIPPFVVRAKSDRSAVALLFSGTAIVANTVPATFTRFEEGCAALAAK